MIVTFALYTSLSFTLMTPVKLLKEGHCHLLIVKFCGNFSIFMHVFSAENDGSTSPKLYILENGSSPPPSI